MDLSDKPACTIFPPGMALGRRRFWGSAPVRPVEVVPCCEAGCDGFRLHCLLQVHGVVSHVFDAAGLQVATARGGQDRPDRRTGSCARSDGASARRARCGERGSGPDPEREDTRRLHRERVGTQKGRTRRSAIVAMACKLTIVLWHRLETGLVPDGAVLKA